MRLCQRLILGMLILLVPALARAHPMGNFSISHHATLTPDGQTLHLRYLLDFAEIPASQELRPFDTNQDNRLSDAEARALLAARGPTLLAHLSLTVNGQPVPLTLTGSAARTRPGAADLPTLLLTFDLTAPLPPSGNLTLTYADTNFPDRTGWAEIVTPRESPGWRLTRSTAHTRDESQSLSAYPTDQLAAPLAAPPNDRTATAAYTRTDEGSFPTTLPALGAGASPAATSTSPVTPVDAFTRLIRPGPLSAATLAISLVVATFMGALHALSPGHGKTVVAAYLVGSRGTAAHALLLGAVVTLTHTIGVFALGLTVLLAGSHLPETLYPWLSFLSGLLILCLGLHQLTRRLTLAAGYSPPLDPHAPTNPRGHSHAMPAKVTPSALVALGISGGLLPCPSALVVLLGAIALHKTALGLVLVLTFSVGLALTLTTIGLLLVFARNSLSNRNLELTFAPRLALLSAAAITLVGAVLTTTALVSTKIFSAKIFS